MIRVKRILFPTDYSVCAERAFGQAAYLADQFGAELHLLHAVEVQDTGSEYLIEDVIISEEEVAEQLQMVTGESMQKPSEDGIRIFQAQQHGASAASVILDYTEEHNIDLIVMGTHGRRGIERLFVGSIAEEVVRLSPCPVLTIRASTDPMPRQAVRKILLPIDFSEHSRVAFRYARILAEVYDARLEVVHVIEEEIMSVVYGLDAMAPPTEQVHKQAAQALRDLVDQEAEADQIATTVTIGHPATEVLAYAKARDVDLIVIATHGRSGLKHFLMGSVAEKIVRMAPCPVFTVKSFGKDLLSPKQAASIQAEEEAL